MVKLRQLIRSVHRPEPQRERRAVLGVLVWRKCRELRLVFGRRLRTLAYLGTFICVKALLASRLSQQQLNLAPLWWVNHHLQQLMKTFPRGSVSTVFFLLAQHVLCPQGLFCKFPPFPQALGRCRARDLCASASCMWSGAVAHACWQDTCPSDRSWGEEFAFPSVLLTQCLTKLFNTLSRAALETG